MNTLDLKSVCWPFFNVVERVSKATLETFISKLDGQQAKPIASVDCGHRRYWSRNQEKCVGGRTRPCRSVGKETDKQLILRRQQTKSEISGRSEASSRVISKTELKSTILKRKTRAWSAWQSSKVETLQERRCIANNRVDSYYREKSNAPVTASCYGSNVACKPTLEQDRLVGRAGEGFVNQRGKDGESSRIRWEWEAHSRDNLWSSKPLQTFGERVSRVASSPRSQREAAIKAIEEVLTPSLCPSREGRGTLEIQLAGYLTALNSSALTNEAHHCEVNVQTKLASMKQCIDRSSRDLRSMGSWIDAAEARLRDTPTCADVFYLQGLLDERSTPSESYPLGVMEGLDYRSARNCTPGANVGSQKELLLYIREEVRHMEDSLARLPGLNEIERMRPKSLDMENEMNRHEQSTREAVNELRQAVVRGEVAWYRNLDMSTSKLESLARVLVPLETTFKGKAASARV